MMTKQNIPATLGEAITRCMEELGRSNHTERTYRNALHTFVEYLGVPLDTPLSQLSVDDFIRFPSWLLRQKLSKSTSLVYKSGVAKFMKWLTINRFIEVSILEDRLFEDACQELSRKHQDHLPEVPSDADVEKVIAVARGNVTENHHTGLHAIQPARDLAIVILFCRSGLRVGELVALKVDDIDMDTRNITIRGGKGDKDEFARFDEDAKDAILSYWETRGYAESEDPAFAIHNKGSNGKRLLMSTGNVRAIMKKFQAQAGVKRIHPHAFRHYFGVRVLRQSGNLALTQDLMRHTSPVVTRKYATIANNERSEAYDKIFGK